MDTIVVPQEPYTLTQVDQYPMDVYFSIWNTSTSIRELLPDGTTVVEAVTTLNLRKMLPDVLPDDLVLEWCWSCDWLPV